MKTVLIIGGGISGLVSSINLSNQGYKVILIEKNDNLGGRLYQEKIGDYILNNGPSWYWLPSVINNVYNKLGINEKDIYKLIRLDPQYKIIFDKNEFNIPNNFLHTKSLFESLDLGITNRFIKFMKTTKYKFEKGLSKFINYENLSISEYINLKLFYYIYKFELFKSYRNVCNKVSKNNYIRKILEWPSLFIGSSPKNITSLYTLLTYSMLKEGTYIPNKRGMIEIVNLLTKYCFKKGVIVFTNTELIDFNCFKNKIISARVKYLKTNELENYKVDYIINSADYYHIEKKLPNHFRSYPKSYWDKLESCPSALLFNICLKIKIPKLQFHNLFFKGSLDEHINCIYKKKKLRPKPLFYVNITTKIFKQEAPKEHETLFILVPSPPNVELDSYDIENVYNYIINELEEYCQINIRNNITQKKVFSNKNFGDKYNSFKNNSYGISCDKFQNIFIRPKIKSLYLDNLYFCGQTTFPGPGISPCMISGLNSSNKLIDDDKKNDLNSDIITRYDTLIYYITKTKYVFFRLLTHFFTLLFIVGFNRDLYYGMKREFKYLVYNKLKHQNNYDL